MASPSSSHHTASGRTSPWASTSAPPTTAAPTITTTLPQWASYLAAPHPILGQTTAMQGGLNPPPGMPSYGSPPMMENIMQMIFDMQTSIGVLSTAVGELAMHMNDFIKNRLAPTQAQSVRSTKSIVACPKPWDRKGDSAAACHFLAAFANWAMSQKEKMNWQMIFGI